jgi:hypothetical protein
VQGGRWLLVQVGASAISALPNATATADFGSWRLTMTTVGNGAFREVHPFRSRRACVEQRGRIEQGAARVMAEQGGTTAGQTARRLRIGPCEAARRGRHGQGPPA